MTMLEASSTRLHAAEATVEAMPGRAIRVRR
jgi:hypothetical protein